VRTADDAVMYLRLAEGICGREWLTARRFRLGASTLLDELLRD
jgi:deoxyribose-phosphate aldolase